MLKHDGCPSPGAKPSPAKRKRPDVAARKAANTLLDVLLVAIASYRRETRHYLSWPFLCSILLQCSFENMLF